MQNNKKLTDTLMRPLPKEALKKHPSRSYLTTINPIYVTDRLNEAFGVGGWQFTPEVVQDDTNPKMIIMRGTLTADKHNIKVIQFGGNDNDDRGDAYKGASTDALTKCASYLGVGAEVWRNGKPAEVELTKEVDKDILAEFKKKFVSNKGLTLNTLNSWLKAKKLIEEKQVYTSLKETQIKDFEKNWDAFIKNVKEHNGTPSDKTTK
jgi:hypothetical protein